MLAFLEQKISAADFNALTEQVGWGTRTPELVEEALRNTLYSVCAYDSNNLIGYGRLIGDKTIFVYVQDVMVIPNYQGKKIGTGIMKRLTSKIWELKNSSPDLRAYLGASKGKENFYKRFGFLTRTEADLGEGMVLL